MPSPDDHALISAALETELGHCPVWPNVCEFADLPHLAPRPLCFFPVDNTLALSDPVVPALMRVLEKVVRDEEYIRQKVRSVFAEWHVCRVRALANQQQQKKKVWLLTGQALPPRVGQIAQIWECVVMHRFPSRGSACLTKSLC